ncbi:aminotransferase class V-fold PLP-dependent enzyme [Corynebacterium pseudotuberculosis]|uniref:Aminotransferase class V-fold PLP-dependent enzyme n=1 Tax=Corynebacterium pseudotuberculosis (strain C231) TaxID=681645 RepID=D9QDP5_CORP2|nr:aminotransferase class V-fold PLP-dependent enzyme [Corynebacterium pseudotuberculosis]ADL09618.1 aminotransferase class V-fold PLP-dependent enzyme [Corynebacterium pseudotuberculosis C231]ADL20023.1 aminotransferase class V-fold PLP-dependent enzyme [Corynebacterium pseudotuberculosis 1002]ADO25415.1 aminotransferase class V-fold PLP-dependent enzyme [Corynebacterium pseudotuberculosis I19]AEP69394.1 Cysteine desulfurase [Corynebacterium pseudotuberculosis 42/02-A]AEX38598.1 Cysteine desu
MVFDVARVRGAYTSVSGTWTYLNAQEQPQIPERVSSAVSRGFRSAPLAAEIERGAGSHALLQRAGRFIADDHFYSARMAIADMTGTSADAVLLGPSRDVLFARLSRALRPLLRRGSSAVFSRTDSCGLDLDAEIRWAEPDLGTGEVPAWQFSKLVDGSTRVVALSAASRQVGTINPILEIAEYVHDSSRAWVLVDATPLAGHRPITREALGADIISVDCEAFGGPQVAALAFRDTTMFPRIDMEVFDTPVAAGLAAGVSAAVDHLADLDEDARGTRRYRLAQGVESAANYLGWLGTYLVDSIESLPNTHVFGVTGEAAAGSDVDRIPHATFCINGVPADMIQQRLINNGLVATVAEADPLLTAMGVGDTKGAISVGLGPYNTVADVDQLIRVVASLA